MKSSCIVVLSCAFLGSICIAFAPSTAAPPEKPAAASPAVKQPAAKTPAASKPAAIKPTTNAKPAAAKPAKPAPPPLVFETAPASVLNPSQWKVAEVKGNVFAVTEVGGRSALTTTARAVTIASVEKLGVDQRIRARFRFTSHKAGAFSVALGLNDPLDLKEKGKLISASIGPAAIASSVADPNSKARLPVTTGSYRPQFQVERSLAWPEALRANVEADMVASQPLTERTLALDVVLRDKGYDVSLDGVPLTSVAADSADPRGFARINLPPGVELYDVVNSPAPLDPTWVHLPIALESVLNARTIDGRTVDRRSFASGDAWEHDGVPFALPQPDAAGNDHVDVGRSWFRAGNVSGRYSGRGADAVSSRWPGALLKDPARITVQLPMARYRALHLLAAADGDTDEVPVITAQFYRAQAGFPKNFAAQIPAFSATSKPAAALLGGTSTSAMMGGASMMMMNSPEAKADQVTVKTADGKEARLFHVTIPIDPSALAEFEDMDYVDVELTKQVQVYRASPDPMYYSIHSAGLPSSVHVFALTAERPALDVKLTADAYAHIWTAPEKPSYTVSIRNRRGKSRPILLQFITKNGERETEQEETILLRPEREAFASFTFKPAAYGLHNVRLTITDGDQTWTESRDMAYLHEDTRERGDWDFGRGPLFGFWNWGGGHHTPSGDKQLLVMAKAGIETTPGSFEEYTARMGDAAKQVMEKYKLFTLKFAGGGDHYVTAKFATDLKTVGLEKAKTEFVETLKKRQSAPGPNSRPMFLSFYAEPSIGPITHGIFPQFIGEPKQAFSDYERERYELFRNGFVEGAKIVREHFPTAKNLLPHGDPAFVVHFLENDAASVAPLLDGVCVDIPCFERLPEQQFHQVSLHRLYMARKVMTDAGVTKPLLPMYEGPCVPSGPGAISDQEQADLTIRNSLMLLVYGVDIQNGGFPAFDTASYWGEQHYGFGVLNRVSLETPKVAYAALATLTRHLNRCNYAKWIPTGSQNVFCLQFKHYQTGKLVHVLWTIRGRRPVELNTAGSTDVVVRDQFDNPTGKAGSNAGTYRFEVTGSPCYVTGLAGDAQLSLREADHSDSQPSADARKLANLGDGTWQLVEQVEKDYEGSHVPYIRRYPSPMTAKTVDAAEEFGGKALAVQFPEPAKDRVFVPYYSVLKPAKPIEIPGKASHLGLWVQAQGDWGRAIYVCRDAKGEQWINIGTRGQWNCDDLHSWMSFNFDGRRYLRMELPANSPWDKFREAGNAWWGPYSSGDGNIDLPLTLEKIIIERRTHVMYVDGPVPADRGDVLLGDLYAEYASPSDDGAEVVRLANLQMPVPTDVRGLGNPIETLAADGVGAAVKIERITLPNQEADGTQCYVHFPKVEGAKHYDIWVAPYADGRGALQLGKAWKEPGLLVRGLRPNQNFYLFATYTDADGKTSKPSDPYQVNLQDFCGMK